MKYEKMRSHVDENLHDDDQLIGLFWSMQPMKFWLFALIGPFAAFSMKFYVVAVSKKGISFHNVNFFERFTETSFFTYDEIEALKLKRGRLNATLRVRFNNGQKLRLTASYAGKESSLSKTTARYLEEKFPIIT